MESESTEQSKEVKRIPFRFQPGNTYGKGGKREGAGRKTQRNKAIGDEVKLSARDIVRRELEKNVGSIMSTYLKLASSGRDPTTTRHAVDKIDPDETITIPTITINFVAFNPSSSPSSPIDVTPSSPVIPSSPAIPAPSSPTVATGLTFTDIKRSR